MELIKSIHPSTKSQKRFMIIYNNKKIHFGLKDGSTFIDHNDIIKRNNYRKRHYSNSKEKYLIDNLIISPSVLSYYILWGNYPDLNKNIQDLNILIKINNK